MTLLSVPPLDDEPWPTLGPQVVAFLQGSVSQELPAHAVFGPGSLKGQPAVVDPEKQAIIYRAYEVYPRGHRLAGKRRFQRVAVSLCKGSSKTELAAWIAYAELHPDGPVRFDGWDASGNPVGRPVSDPYIPLVGFAEEQTEELAFGALYVMCSEGPDADLFDAGLERIVRLDDRGRADGKAEAVAAAPNSRDGARTTHQSFDETHRLYLPRYLAAHQTMQANLTKRPLDDPWHLEITTAGELGQGSIAENTHIEAEKIAAGEYEDPDLLYHHRQAGDGHDLLTRAGRVAAIAEARGGVGEYAPGQFESIARLWERPRADVHYLERVWLNRWVKAAQQAFDPAQWKRLRRESRIPEGELVVAGFDGARFRDSTGIVLTDVVTGLQEVAAVWERPADLPDTAGWEISEAEVTTAWDDIRGRYQLWKVYGDPPHWTETYGSWSAKWPDVFEEWWTIRQRPMANAIREYSEALKSQQVTWSAGGPMGAGLSGDIFTRHVLAVGRHLINMWFDDPDAEGDKRQAFLIEKQHPDRKIDLAMCAILSWQARLEAIRSGAKKRGTAIPRRIR